MKKAVRDLNLKGKRVLIRVDFNVPLKEEKIRDDRRIKAALPTLQYIREEGGRLIVMTHLGRPKGEVLENLRLKPVVTSIYPVNICQRRSYMCASGYLGPHLVKPDPQASLGSLPGCFTASKTTTDNRNIHTVNIFRAIHRGSIIHSGRKVSGF